MRHPDVQEIRFAKELGRRILDQRTARRLGLVELARRLGVTRNTLANWEAGRTLPSAVAVARLCVQLNVSADWLLARASWRTEFGIRAPYEE